MDVHLLVTPIADLFVMEQKVFHDQRGRFARLFCQGSLERQGLDFQIRQVNHSRTVQKSTVRGLHFQLDKWAEAKLVTCVRGAIWDVAVDLRANSSTFLQWHAIHLEADSGRSFLLPKGFAHGFQALTNDAEVLYFSDADYAAAHESGLHALDRRLGIDWPLAVANLSAKDAAHPWLDETFRGFTHD